MIHTLSHLMAMSRLALEVWSSGAWHFSHHVIKLVIYALDYFLYNEIANETAPGWVLSGDIICILTTFIVAVLNAAVVIMLWWHLTWPSWFLAIFSQRKCCSDRVLLQLWQDIPWQIKARKLTRVYLAPTAQDYNFNRHWVNQSSAISTTVKVGSNESLTFYLMP